MLPNKRFASSAPQTQRANQSPPLKPAQPKNTQQPARDRRRLRNGHPIYLNVIDYILGIEPIGLSVGEMQAHEEHRVIESAVRS